MKEMHCFQIFRIIIIIFITKLRSNPFDAVPVNSSWFISIILIISESVFHVAPSVKYCHQHIQVDGIMHPALLYLCALKFFCKLSPLNVTLYMITY